MGKRTIRWEVTLYFLLLAHQLHSQVNLTGFLLDRKTNYPVEFASIYINGTTLGTMSDEKGYFNLSIPPHPCTIVFSHLSYEIRSLDITTRSDTSIHVNLNPAQFLIEEVEIDQQSNREHNMNIFKRFVLGIDSWGRKAKINNDGILFFNVNYMKETVSCNSDYHLQYLDFIENEKGKRDKSDSLVICRLKEFQAFAREPLKILLPVTSYHLHLDLTGFEIDFFPEINQWTFNYSGYYYYHPIEPNSRREGILINRKRMKAYFNSSMHLGRSIFEKRLKENGFRITELIELDSVVSVYREVNLDSILHYPGNNEVQIVGQESRHYFVQFYIDNKTRLPLDLTQYIGEYPELSELIITSDTCIIRGNGTIPNADILISGSMGKKQVGASLPADFQVPVNH